MKSLAVRKNSLLFITLTRVVDLLKIENKLLKLFCDNLILYVLKQIYFLIKLFDQPFLMCW